MKQALPGTIIEISKNAHKFMSNLSNKLISIRQMKFNLQLIVILLTILLLHLFISTQIFAQNLSQTIRGTVVDKQSGSPIIGANVVIMDTDPILGNTTDIDGQFRITNVPIGRHHLKVSFIGYEETGIPELLVGTGKEIILNIEMAESLIKMDEIVIRATEHEKGKPLNEMALISAQSFSVEQTNRYAATFDDPARAVLSMAGITGSGDDGTNEIVIRGNSPRGVLWRVEGVEVPNPNHFAGEGSSAGAISMLSGIMLSNSDFFTGAFPAEYGNALSGVFDINLRQGNNEKREYAFQAGLLGLAFSAEGPINKNSKGSYLANYRYSTVDLIDKLGVDIIEERERVTFQDFSFKVHQPSEKFGSFTLWGIGGASKYIYEADPEQNDFFQEDSYNKMMALGLSHIYFLNENTYLKSKVSWSGLENRFLEDSLGQRIRFDETFTHKALRASTMINHKFNAQHTLRAGIRLNHLDYDLNAKFWNRRLGRLVTDLESDGSTQLLQSYVQWQFRMNEQLTLNTGVHYAHFALNGSGSIEPRFGAKWQFKDNQAFSLGFGIHSRLEPIPLYLAQQERQDGSFFQPNKNLAMTKAAHYVLGYERTFAQNLRFKTEFYYQQLFDVPIAHASTAVEPWELTFSSLNEKDGYTNYALVNDGTGRNYGVELTFEKFFNRNYYFIITGSLFESKYKGADKIERNTRFNANYATNITAGKEFKVGRSGNNMIGINGRMIWGGGQRVLPIDLEASRSENRTIYKWDELFERQLPDYMRFDIGIQYRRNKPSHASILALNIQNFTGRFNVFDEYYDRSSGTIKNEEQLGLFPNLSYRIEF
ncbi:TonB-dependent receptor [Fulvivirgaceae bacterium BMA10]|uniref:TonB-dependent receptor n=1 Tax=Splendidivirga corallicola TaxID=3051826 RepID=A0ABT8KR30_9BACT|nr:TonB-dependent receptor [Fulvivirgaceae bacterium BMA10]